MTPKQLKEATDIELIKAYKNKARCYHSKQISDSIYRELETRFGSDVLYDIRLEAFHVQNGECDKLFNIECDKLISKINDKEE